MHKFYIITKTFGGNEYEQPVYAYDSFSYVSEGIQAGNRILNALMPNDLESLEYALLCDSNVHRDVVYVYDWVYKIGESVYEQNYQTHTVFYVGNYKHTVWYDGFTFVDSEHDTEKDCTCVTPERFADYETECMVDCYGIHFIPQKQLNEIRERILKRCESRRSLQQLQVLKIK